jgi:hypothetical protein
MAKRSYTHTDGSGMPWRMEGSRPVSALADKVMAEVTKPTRGGARTGSGRKKGPATKVLTFRVPVTEARRITKLVKAALKTTK